MIPSLSLLEVGLPSFIYVEVPSDMSVVVTTLVYKIGELLFGPFFIFSSLH